MKNINWFVCLLVLLSTLTVRAQITPGNNCDDASCSTQGSYSSQTGSPSMGAFGCLYSTPNANWIAINTQTSGSIHFVLTQTNSNGSGIDVDFAVYGPYTSVSAGCPITGSTPTVDCSYSATSTEYIDIPNAQAGDVYIILITNYNGSAGTISLTPNTSNPSTATIDCNINFTGTTTSTPALCGQATGSVDVVPTGGFAPYTYSWNIPGNPTTASVSNVPPGTYTVTITSSPDPVSGATYIPTTLTVTVGDQIPTVSATSTTVSCPGGSDGTATASSTAPGTLSYQWNDPNSQTVQTAVGLTAGVYECIITSSTGCVDTVQVTVTEIPGMQLQVVNQVDVTCNSGTDGIAEIAVTGGTIPYSFDWTGSNSSTELADDLAFGTTTVTVTDDQGCVITEDISIDQPAALEITQMSQDTIICIGDSVRLFAQGTGGSSPYIYSWSSNNQNVANGNEIYVTPTGAYTEYCVTLSEQCGSPIDNACVIVEYPSEVNPSLAPDKTGECFPIEVTFENTTNTAETVSYTIWSYTDGEKDTVPGDNPVVHEFGEGIFGVDMEVVTNRGCRYTASYPELIEGFPYPEASFYVNPNPASIFEPKVTAYSQSSSDISSYEWFAEGAKPEYSSIQNPSFTYSNDIQNYPLILVVENSYGCTDTLQKLVRIENEVLIFTPNTFTPDGDGVNDTWKVQIQGIDVQNFHLEIYNRWGEKVFESLDPNGEWDGTYGDGKIVRDGAYMWTIRAYDFENDNKYEFNGTVTILK